MFFTERAHVVQVRAEGPKGQKQHALYLSLRPVTVGSRRVGKTCESSVDNKIKNEEFH